MRRSQSAPRALRRHTDRLRGVPLLSILLLVVAGVFWLLNRGEILSLHRATIGGRFPMGCVIAEAIVLLVIAAIALALHFSGVLL